MWNKLDLSILKGGWKPVDKIVSNEGARRLWISLSNVTGRGLSSVAWPRIGRASSSELFEI